MRITGDGEILDPGDETTDAQSHLPADDPGVSITLREQIAVDLWLAFSAVTILAAFLYPDADVYREGIAWTFVTQILFVGVAQSGFSSIRFGLLEMVTPNPEEYEFSMNPISISMDLLLVTLFCLPGWLGITPTFWFLRMGSILGFTLLGLRLYSFLYTPPAVWVILTNCFIGFLLLDWGVPQDSSVWTVGIGGLTAILYSGFLHHRGLAGRVLSLLAIAFIDYQLLGLLGTKT